ncbi:quinone oxidoreductase family protein [Micromonospora rifamycinica]|uniref:NADPH2:quinone reductase n=1 Tax=Micromonospora rifamycinica TaxID=291594 RepID=A0A120F9X6_9ACTN|nr:zinc-binding dehydrogenase [Micromonospora rifamycinica]KWV34057.1 zinc-binding alcohol dehydrogenase [Micromonospora rifamycinica]SCG47173.1 NADPH2:quinone reductase [Micromonospora rifamycinica]
MKAAVLHTLGDRPRYAEVPEPAPGDGQVVVDVTACPLTNLDRVLAAGTHFASPSALPAVCGSLAAGRLPGGARVLFRSPDGAMAERALTRPELCTPIPDGVDDDAAAAIQNPGVSTWAALEWRARMRPGEHVLVLGATGVAGQIAVQLARHLGAGRVVGAGRNPRVLAALPGMGADATIRVDQRDEALGAAFRAEADTAGFDVVIDFLWGRPTEVLLGALGRADMELRSLRTRLVQVGAMAGGQVTLSAEVLRSSGVEICGFGTGNAPPPAELARLRDGVLALLAGGILGIGLHRVPLAEVAEVWNADERGVRTVLIP